MSRFPAVTETFILRELIQMKALGQRVEIAPLLRENAQTLHPEAEDWDRRALYTPFLNPAIIATNLSVLFSSPITYFKTFATLLWEARKSLNAFVGTLGIFPKSVYNGQRLRKLGISHVHAHFATHPATCAYVMKHVKRRNQRDLPYSLTVHAHDIFIGRAGLLRKLQAAAFVRCISRFNVDYLLERFPGKLHESKFRVIHCGIEPGRYHHSPRTGKPGTERTCNLLCIAALRPYKGLTHLIEAVRRMRADGRDVRCEVIGGGFLLPQLEKQISDAGLNEHFKLVGTRTQDQVVAALANTDVFILPSIVADDGQMEGIPVVLMEALAAGIPTIATRISGIPELVIDEETGFLATPADPDALVGALDRVLADYERAQSLAANGTRLVESQFELRDNVAALLTEIQRSNSQGSD